MLEPEANASCRPLRSHKTKHNLCFPASTQQTTTTSGKQREVSAARRWVMASSEFPCCCPLSCVLQPASSSSVKRVTTKQVMKSSEFGRSRIFVGAYEAWVCRQWCSLMVLCGSFYLPTVCSLFFLKHSCFNGRSVTSPGIGHKNQTCCTFTVRHSGGLYFLCWTFALNANCPAWMCWLTCRSRWSNSSSA